MATTFKNGVSLHRLLEAAPLQALASFLEKSDGVSTRQYLLTYHGQMLATMPAPSHCVTNC